MNELRKLPETYKKNGLELKLVKRNDKTAMYEGFDGMPYWEVFKIRIAKPYIRTFKDGRTIMAPLRERLPGNEDFGNWAWTYRTNEPAEDKYNEINGGL